MSLVENWTHRYFQDRFIEVFEKRLADGVEITALGCADGNGTDARIAVGTRNSLEFTSNQRDVLVFGMYDGAMYTLGSSNGKVVKSKSLGQKM
ncbi:hypothetical protein GSI_09575 [Ganoderma sinense ZZ0214-1]|uniref:Uncharacterized protein n=1 Tax=Ganoderma sinense ZZ0214-1 TaxID=1077348 RepID=A0A2G8S3I7_9APHY|nr:hypothetical protein GSI_09575 [Ganoderma sinense ZZ0214-1]